MGESVKVMHGFKAFSGDCYAVTANTETRVSPAIVMTVLASVIEFAMALIGKEVVIDVATFEDPYKTQVYELRLKVKPLS